MVAERKSSSMKRSIPRTTVKLAMAGLLIAGMSACGGGGGGDSSDDVDLRAAYDRINRSCMTFADVDKAIGRPADDVPSAGRKRWESGNQRLSVTFAVLSSGLSVSNGVTWTELPGRELSKDFDPNVCN